MLGKGGGGEKGYVAVRTDEEYQCDGYFPLPAVC